MLRVFAITLVLCAVSASSQQTLKRVVQGTAASVLVVDVASGKILESYGPLDVTALPGSTLKPFVLQAALNEGVVTERATVNCHGALVVKGHNLACTHPRDITVLDARQALAESCNTYFATLAERMPAKVLLHGLRGYGLRPSGSAGVPEDRALLALGVEGLRVSPRQLAMAYQELALAMQHGDRGATVVREGMVQSVNTGMAHAAHVDGMTIAGKTGSMHDASDPQGHGWFAGVVFDERGQPTRVVVIYLPGGNGNDAAALARRYLLGAR